VIGLFQEAIKGYLDAIEPNMLSRPFIATLPLPLLHTSNTHKLTVPDYFYPETLDPFKTSQNNVCLP
jgi:hypothetical protein